VLLHHRLDGPASAPVLVLANPLGTTLDVWDAGWPRWVRDLRVLRYDHPGHGGSAGPAVGLDVDALGRGVVDLLDALGIERASFCGLSLGGAVAMWLAATEPHRVAQLVLASTSARFGDPAAWRGRARLVRRRGTEAIADRVLGAWFTPAFTEAHPGVVARFRSMLESTSDEGYAASCDALAAWDFRTRLGQIGAPTLVLGGAADPATPPAHAQLLAAGIPDARLELLRGCAHLANVEEPEAFSALVREHVLGPRAV